MVPRAVLLLSVLYFCGNAYPVIDNLPNVPYHELPMCGLMMMKEIADESKPIEYKVSTTALSWSDARDKCKAKGMMLASPITDLERSGLIMTLYKHNLAPVDAHTGYWIGSHRLSSNDPWIWESNGQNITGSGWLYSEPKGNDTKDCIELARDSRDFRDYHNSLVLYRTIGLNNYFCSGLRRYICEPVKNKELPTYVTPNPRGPPCKFSQNETQGNSEERQKYIQELDATFPKPVMI